MNYSNVLQPYGDSIWIADGPIVRGFGFPFPTRMIVVRLADGGVWINSPVEWTPEDMLSVARIGPVKHLVSPTPLHDWRLEAWAKAFPDAHTWPATSLGEAAPPDWGSDLDQIVFRGSRVLNEVEFLHRPSRTLIMGDFIQNYAHGRNGALKLFFKLAGVDGGMPIDARASFIGNKALGRASLERLLAWDFDKVVLAHGACIERDAPSFVRRAFAWLT